MLLSIVSATIAVKTLKLECLGLVETKHLKTLILTVLIFFLEIVRNF